MRLTMKLSNRVNFNDANTIDKLVQLFEDKQTTLSELIDSCKKQNTFCDLLSNWNFFRILLRRKLIEDDDLRLLQEHIVSYTEFVRFNTYYQSGSGPVNSLVLYMIDHKLLNFTRYVDSCAEAKDAYGNSALTGVIGAPRNFDEFLIQKKITSQDLAHLTNSLTNSYEFWLAVRYNLFLFEHCLKHHLIKPATFRKFDKFAKIDGEGDFLRTVEGHLENLMSITAKSVAPKKVNIEELMKIPKSIYKDNTFSITQQDQLSNVVYSSKEALNLLTQFIDTNIFDQYDFDTLMRLLTKNESKKKLKMNF